MAMKREITREDLMPPAEYAKVRAARRPAPGMPVVEPKRPVVTYRQTNRA